MREIPALKEILLKTASAPADGGEPFHTRASMYSDGHWLLPVLYLWAQGGMPFPSGAATGPGWVPCSRPSECFQMPDHAARDVWNGALQSSLFDKISGCHHVAYQAEEAGILPALCFSLGILHHKWHWAYSKPSTVVCQEEHGDMNLE